MKTALTNINNQLSKANEVKNLFPKITAKTNIATTNIFDRFKYFRLEAFIPYPLY
jgi:hypothetical protein